MTATPAVRAASRQRRPAGERSGAGPVGGALPRYRTLADRLRTDLSRGRFKVGARLPGEVALSAQFGVSRHTVREALRRLEADGLIERRRRLGTRVRASAPTERYVQTLSALDGLLQYPAESRLRVVDCRAIRASARLARLLGVAVGSRWQRIRAMRIAGPAGVVLCSTVVYVLPDYAGVVAHIGRDASPVYALIERLFAEHVAQVQVQLRASCLTGRVARALSVPAGSASLDVVRRFVGRAGRVVEISVASHPADRFTYSFEVQRGLAMSAGPSTAGVSS